MTTLIATPEASREVGRLLSNVLCRQPEEFGQVRLSSLDYSLAELADVDLVVLIHADPVEELYDFIGRAHQQVANLPVMVWGAPETPELVVEYLVSGARACFLEGEVPARLFEAFPAVLNGSHYLPPDVQRILLGRFVEVSSLIFAGQPGAHHSTDGLTDREREVLELLALGYTNPEIAERLFLEVGTVKNHVHHILSKLALPDRQAAASYYHTRQRFIP
ncbi:MAG TPA: response regulator transcription factor [Thermomicrobiales bacterium]|nr:response regulator transcription factor [Thermomicrobiales bacterium]